MVPQVGQRIGPYEILGRLGTGGMGLVFSAWDARLQRDVAIKILRDEYATSDMRSRFLQEARAVSGLNHPNICTIFDIGEQDGDPFLVMELLKGETLRARINAGDIHLQDIVQVGREVADALSVAHARGIIHRDIKPANIILVDKPGGYTTKVLDFGLAKVEAFGETLFDLTHTGTTVGTVAYMSPEQARGETLDARSDLFSLGVILYEMATGRLPFQGATSALVFVELLSKQPMRVRQLNPAIPEVLEEIILRLLEKDCEDRYQNGSEVVEALTALSMGGSSSSMRATGVASPADRWSATYSASAPPSLSSRQVPIAPGKAISGEGQTPAPGSRADRLLRQMQRQASSSSTQRIAGREEAEDSGSKSVSENDFLRPVPRIVSGESSSHRIAQAPSRQEPESLPEDAELEDTVSEASQELANDEPEVRSEAEASRFVVEPAGPSYDQDSNRGDMPSRPIVPQSARKPLPREPFPVIQFPRQPSVRPTPRFARIEEVDPAELFDPPAPIDLPPQIHEVEPSSRWWLLPLLLLLVALLGIGAWKFWPRHVETVSSRVIPIGILSSSNTTGDSALGGALTAGIVFDLSQSPQFLVEDQNTLDVGLQSIGLQASSALALEDIRRGAQTLLVTELLQSEIRRNGNAYVVAVRVITASSGAEILRREETAQSREQIADAIDRLVIDLRTASGEATDSVTNTAVPLSREATSNLDALSGFARASTLLGQGQLEDSAAVLEQAAALDPNFTQAWLRLADIYCRQLSESSASRAALAAQKASANSSPRIQQLALGAVALNVTGDLSALNAAAQNVLQTHPHDVRARVDAAVSLLGQGRFPEADQAAQAALSHEPYNVAALRTSVVSLIGQERLNAAHSSLDRVNAESGAAPDLKLLLIWLQSDLHGPVDLSASALGHVALGEMQASLLAAMGDTGSAHRLWQGIAAEAGTQPTLFSAAGDALAREALDMALLENCTQANASVQAAMAYPSGPDILFRSALASALCDNLPAAKLGLGHLQQQYAKSFRVQNSYVPSLQAVLQWKSGDAAAGLQTLLNARQADLISLAPYLRGLIHLKSNHSSDAVADFQLVLQHPGATALINPLLLSLAQLNMARAYSATGDQGNSAVAYARYLQLVPMADPSSPLATEARDGSVH